MLLAGDIGGTNSSLAMFDSNFQKVHESVTKNAGRTSFTEIVRDFLKSAPQDAVKQIRKGCCGVAGPVANGKVTLTNLSWQLDEVKLAQELGLEKLALINDLVAHAEGIELLKPDQLGPTAALPSASIVPADITQAALADSNKACVAAMDLFVHFYGAEAGNLALKLLAVGGVYLGGGIAPRILEKLKSPAFLDAF